MNYVTVGPQSLSAEEGSFFSIPLSRAALFLALAFVVSPASLYVNRLSSLLAVFTLLVVSLFLLAIPALSVEHAPTPIDLPSWIFLSYMGVNCAVAILSGNKLSNAFADLVSPAELYLSFAIAKRIDLSRQILAGWTKWIMIFATTRAIWQLFTTLAGIHMLSPIYDASVSSPVATIGHFTYERPIDPVSGIIFALALTASILCVQRKWAVIAAGFTGSVLLLGMTRSEWIAAFFAVGTAMWYAGQLRKTVKALLIVVLIVGLTFILSPDLYTAVRDRLIAHTLEQISESSDATIGALRILEYGTALEKFRTAPIFGHGLGSWFGTTVTRDGDLIFVQLHNSYLNLLTNAGLVGVALLLVVMLRTRKFLADSMAIANNTTRTYFCTATTVLVWYGIFMAFEPIYAAYNLPVLIGVQWGLATRCLKSQGVEYPSEDQRF